LLLISIVIDSLLLVKNWGRMHSWQVFILIMFGAGGVLLPWAWAVSSHRRVYDSYKILNNPDSITQDTLDNALAAAATMTLDALFICFTTISMLLALLYRFFCPA
jgi:hypothetical protein